MPKWFQTQTPPGRQVPTLHLLFSVKDKAGMIAQTPTWQPPLVLTQGQWQIGVRALCQPVSREPPSARWSTGKMLSTGLRCETQTSYCLLVLEVNKFTEACNKSDRKTDRQTEIWLLKKVPEPVYSHSHLDKGMRCWGSSLCRHLAFLAQHSLVGALSLERSGESLRSVFLSLWQVQCLKCAVGNRSVYSRPRWCFRTSLNKSGHRSGLPDSPSPSSSLTSSCNSPQNMQGLALGRGPKWGPVPSLHVMWAGSLQYPTGHGLMCASGLRPLSWTPHGLPVGTPLPYHIVKWKGWGSLATTEMSLSRAVLKILKIQDLSHSCSVSVPP